jgi:pSer/pThr/pTyr-binding forkhead associated (FHA) protein
MRQTTEFTKSGSQLGTTIRQSLKMMAGKDVPNYTLVFLDPTKQNKRGESKNIVIPYIVLGRESSCNIQYDESYSTVSRQHAAIQMDEQGCTLIHNPNATNPTLVDGRPISSNYKLKTGDEIQLANEGPRVRFLMENAKGQVKTSTMGFTRRMSMAMGQALRPYKRALAAVGLLLIMATAYSVWSSFRISDLNQEQLALDERIEEDRLMLDDLEQARVDAIAEGEEGKERADQMSRQISSLRYRLKENEAQYERQGSNSNAGTTKAQGASVSRSNRNTASASPNLSEDLRLKSPENEVIVADDLSDIEDDVYYVLPVPGTFKLYTNSKKFRKKGIDVFNQILNQNLWSGTGFMTDDGKFITARHVIEPWIYMQDCGLFSQLNYLVLNGDRVDVTFRAYSKSGEYIEFTNHDMRIDRTADVDVTIDCGRKRNIKVKSYSSSKTDWAYVSLENRASNLIFDRNLSASLQKGEQLYVLGYPHGLALQDLYSDGLDKKFLGFDPVFSTATVAQDGLKNSLLYVSNNSFDKGNSGGPIIAKRNGKYRVVGIVSFGISEIGGVVPTANIK